MIQCNNAVGPTQTGCGTILLPDGTCPRCAPVYLREPEQQKKVGEQLQAVADDMARRADIEAERVTVEADDTIPFGSPEPTPDDETTIDDAPIEKPRRKVRP